MNVYNYIFECILASNRVILSVYLHYERQNCKNKSFLLIKRAKFDQFEKTKVIWKALFMAFKMVNSNWKNCPWLKIYSGINVEKSIKKVVFCRF